jgi:hypothetical protein
LLLISNINWCKQYRNCCSRMTPIHYYIIQRGQLSVSSRTRLSPLLCILTLTGRLPPRSELLRWLKSLRLLLVLPHRPPLALAPLTFLPPPTTPIIPHLTPARAPSILPPRLEPRVQLDADRQPVEFRSRQISYGTQGIDPVTEFHEREPTGDLLESIEAHMNFRHRTDLLEMPP